VNQHAPPAPTGPAGHGEAVVSTVGLLCLQWQRRRRSSSLCCSQAESDKRHGLWLDVGLQIVQTAEVCQAGVGWLPRSRGSLALSSGYSCALRFTPGAGTSACPLFRAWEANGKRRELRWRGWWWRRKAKETRGWEERERDVARGPGSCLRIECLLIVPRDVTISALTNITQRQGNPFPPHRQAQQQARISSTKVSIGIVPLSPNARITVMIACSGLSRP